MKDIMNLVFLGIIVGMVSGLWTRIIKKGMILYQIGEWLEKINAHSWINKARSSSLVKFFNCIFCLSPWLCLPLDVFYIIDYNPYWIYTVIGVFGGLGAGNLTAEIIYSLRDRE